MHIGRGNKEFDYFMKGHKLEVVEEEKDIGVTMHRSLRPSSQCTQAAGRANRVLYQLSKVFHYRDKFVFLKLYKQYVRPHLEYSIQSWNPWTAADVDLLEAVQKKAIRMISGLQGRTYEEKLEELGIESLKDRRLRLDSIQTFKILKGHDNVNYKVWFDTYSDNPSSQSTRLSNHPLNLRYRGLPRTEVRKNFFSQRVIPAWNNLPSEIKDSITISAFKNNYSLDAATA